MSQLKIISQSKCFGGTQSVYSHQSTSTGSIMRFGIFLPPAAQSTRVPVLYWLSGLTCTEENFIIKAGAQRVAAELGIAIVVPDTSPRGLKLAGEDASSDIGPGAGFYLDATEKPWAEHYQMYTYTSKELPTLIATNFDIDQKRAGIFGHSMGGHGALSIALKNPEQYKSVSAFAPICAPSQSASGQLRFNAYLGSDQNKWNEYDSTCLIASRGWKGGEILIDQGTADQFLSASLQPELFREACARAGVKLNLRMQEGYDHSYFFVATFMEDHLRFHAKYL